MHSGPAHRSPEGDTTRRDLLALLVIGALSVAIFAPVVLYDHVIPNIDLLTHYRWLMQYQAALGEGTWYPRWMPRMSLGLGELFYSAYPLYYHVASFSVLAGLAPWTAMKTLAIVSAWCAGAIAYFSVKRLGGIRIGLLASMLVVLSPLPIFLFTHHQALPWHFSLPLAVALLLQSVTPPWRGKRFLIALTVCLLILAHILVAYMTLLSVGAVLCAETLASKRTTFREFLSDWVLPVVVGIGLTAFNTLPALAFMELRIPLSPDDPELVKFLSWQNSFAFPTWTAAHWGMRWFAMQWPLPSLSLFMAAAAAWILWRTRPADDDRAWTASARLVGITAAALILASELAYPIYATVGVARSVQWPYRFVSVAALSSVLALALAAATCAHRSVRRRTCAIPIAASIGFAFTLVAALEIQLASEGRDPALSPKLLEGEFSQYGAAFVTRGPGWKQYATDGGFVGECRRKEVRCDPLLQRSQHRSWAVTATRPVNLLLPMYAFPGWTTRIDGRDVAYGTDTRTGLVAVPVPAGTHTVEIELAGFRPWSAIGLLISLASAVSLLALALWPRVLRRGAAGRSPLEANAPEL